MYEIDPASVFSSIVCPMTKLDGSQVSDRCPLGYLSKIFFSETAWPIKAKLYVEPPREGETKVCINGPGHITMTAMLIYVKNPSKYSSPEPLVRFPQNLASSIWDSSPL